MGFYQRLYEKLKGRIPENLFEKLPRTCRITGKVAIVKLSCELEAWKKEIGNAIMEILPVKTVCVLKRIEGIERKPIVEVIAGNGTETLHKEHGCIYKIDVSKFMFSHGNKAEKLRIISLVRNGEIIADMFAGIGYFTIPLAKLTKAKKIYAAEINPDTVKYLLENVKLNKVEEKIEVFEGDCREMCKILAEKGVKVDRVLMGYLFESEKFLPYALLISKKDTYIHFHFLSKEEEVENMLNKIKQITTDYNAEISIKSVKRVKSYAPRIYHMVADILVENLKS